MARPKLLPLLAAVLILSLLVSIFYSFAQQREVKTEQSTQLYRTDRTLKEVTSLESPEESVSSTGRNQLVVMGMHKSGSSLVSKVLNLMLESDSYVEPENLLLEENARNTKEEDFFEGNNKEVFLLNQWLFEMGNQGKGPKWAGFGFDLKEVPVKKQEFFTEEANQLFQKLKSNDHKNQKKNKINTKKTTTILKDPRMSFSFPLWKPVLESPVCVLNYRDPILIVESLKKYEELSEGEWLGLWENYTISSLESCASTPTIFISQHELETNLTGAIERLYQELKEIGLPDLVTPSDSELEKLQAELALKKEENTISALQEQSSSSKLGSRHLSKNQRTLVDIFEQMFENKEFLTPSQILSRMQKKEKKEGFATFLHNVRDESELIGVLSLLHSIKQIDQEQRELLILTNEEPNESVSNLLKEFGARIILQTPILPQFSDGNTQGGFSKEVLQSCQTKSSETANAQPEEWTLLRLWQLEEFSKLIFLKSGGLVFDGVNKYFEVKDVFGAERPKKAERGPGRDHEQLAEFFVLEPNNSTFTEMIQVLESLRTQPITRTEEGQGESGVKSVAHCSVYGFLNDFFGRFIRGLRIGRPDQVQVDFHLSPPPLTLTSSSTCPQPWQLSQNSSQSPSNTVNNQDKQKEKQKQKQEENEKERSEGLRKKRVGCAIPRGCNASLYRLWWNNLPSLDSWFHQKSTSVREQWKSLLHSSHLYFACSRAV